MLCIHPARPGSVPARKPNSADRRAKLAHRHRQGRQQRPIPEATLTLAPRARPRAHRNDRRVRSLLFSVRRCRPRATYNHQSRPAHRCSVRHARSGGEPRPTRHSAARLGRVPASTSSPAAKISAAPKSPSKKSSASSVSFPLIPPTLTPPRHLRRQRRSTHHPAEVCPRRASRVRPRHTRSSTASSPASSSHQHLSRLRLGPRLLRQTPRRQPGRLRRQHVPRQRHSAHALPPGPTLLLPRPRLLPHQPRSVRHHPRRRCAQRQGPLGAQLLKRPRQHCRRRHLQHLLPGQQSPRRHAHHRQRPHRHRKRRHRRTDRRVRHPPHQPQPPTLRAHPAPVNKATRIKGIKAG